MPKRYVEGKSGSRVRPPRYGVSPSCSPLWRRYRHDCSTGNAGPWRRLYNDPERAWAGIIPSDGFGSGARSAGGLGWGLRPVGPVAQAQGPSGGGRAGGPPPPRERRRRGGPVRACGDAGPDGRVHPQRHLACQPGALRGDTLGVALAERTAAGGPGAGLADPSNASVVAADGQSPGGRPGWRETRPTEQNQHQGAGGWAAGVTALPQPPYPTLGQPAEHRGGEQ